MPVHLVCSILLLLLQGICSFLLAMGAMLWSFGSLELFLLALLGLLAFAIAALSVSIAEAMIHRLRTGKWELRLPG